MSPRLVFRPRQCTALLAALLLGSAAPSLAAPGAEARAALARAQELLAEGRLYPAELAAREAIAVEPDLAEAHRLLGRILMRRQKPAPAVAAFERAAALAPEATGLERELGVARFEAGDFAGAREAIRRAIARDPEDTPLRLRLGRCELALGRPERAAREFERAARDPDYRQVALYNLGVAREQAGQRDAAREAFEGALAQGPTTPISSRAWTRIQVLERADDDRPWHLALGAGLFYDSNVRREELDRASGEPDGAGQLEFEASYELPVWGWFELEAGYDFDQSLHFDAGEFDLQSHGFHAAASRRLGPSDASLSYVYSLNTLDGSRFLDFHEVRPALGFAPTPWWYASLAPALRVKRFDSEPRRDAEQGVIGLLQLFALGDWERYLLIGVDGELEDADDRAFDHRGLTAQAGLRLPFSLGEREQHLDLRYRYRHRDYTDASSSPSGRRRDRIHSARARLEIPIARYVAIRAEYEFVDATSDVRSADYTDHTVGATLRLEM